MTGSGAELVLPLVVRIERDAPPARTDALVAAARAVVLLLAGSGQQWHAAVAEWDGQRIRKVVRRARGAGWRRALALPGLDVDQGSAQLRVYPPVPIDDWPRDLARLQVGGTDLARDAPPPADPALPLVVLSPHAAMTTGKAMAQAAHAAHLGWRSMSGPERDAWVRAGVPLEVRDAGLAQWHEVVASGAPVVHDGGFTEVAPGTATAAFITATAWPRRRP